MSEIYSPEEEISTPDVSNMLSFLKDNYSYKYRDLTDERGLLMDEVFKQSFKKLSETEQEIISLRIKALNKEIDSLEDKNEGIAIIKRDEILKNITEIMEDSGVVFGAKEQSLDLFRKGTKDGLEKMLVQLNTLEDFMGRYKDKNKKYISEYLSAIISGIRQELDRLNIVDAGSVKSQDNPEAYYDRQDFINTIKFIVDIEHYSERAADRDGLIGLSAFNNLLRKFCEASKDFSEVFFGEDVD